MEAIKSLNPESGVWIVDGNKGIDECTINWREGTTPISKADIKVEVDKLQAEYDAKDYARKRKAEYPSIPDQLDDIYHNGVEGWKTSIQVIKNKYPKS